MSIDVSVVHKPLQFFVLVIITHDKNNIFVNFLCVERKRIVWFLFVINVRSFVVVVVLQLTLNNKLNVESEKKRKNKY